MNIVINGVAVTNQQRVLAYLIASPNATCRTISLALNVTERQVANVIHGLCETGKLRMWKQGRGRIRRVMLSNVDKAALLRLTK